MRHHIEHRDGQANNGRSAYFHSATTLNYIRALLSSGFASLHHPREWSLTHVRSPGLRKEFERITEGLSDALGFTRTIGLGWENTPYEKGGSRGVLDEVALTLAGAGARDQAPARAVA